MNQSGGCHSTDWSMMILTFSFIYFKFWFFKFKFWFLKFKGFLLQRLCWLTILGKISALNFIRSNKALGKKKGQVYSSDLSKSDLITFLHRLTLSKDHNSRYDTLASFVFTQSDLTLTGGKIHERTSYKRPISPIQGWFQSTPNFMATLQQQSCYQSDEFNLNTMYWTPK